MATIKEVANEAGVSIRTVSRVLNENGYVSEDARAKIERASRKLGFVPNQAARSLASGRTTTIGMVVPDISFVYFSELAFSVETAAAQAGYSMILCNTNSGIEEEKRALKILHAMRVDGVIMATSYMPMGDLMLALAPHTAFVSINRPVPSEVGGNVLSESAKGSSAAVEHLVKSGRKVIAYMTGAPDAYTSSERLRGFLQAIKEANRTISPSLIVSYEANLNGYSSLHEMLQSAEVGSDHWNQIRLGFGQYGAFQLLRDHPQVDAIVCHDDQFAYGALRACAELGRRVPDDVAIIGCNDIPLASQTVPTLTTQRIPRYQMGAAAVKMLIERINGNPNPEPIVFPHELIFRQSAPAIP